MTDKELILGRIRDSLTRNRAMLQREADAYPPPHPQGPFVASELEPVAQFTEELEALQGHVHHCTSPQAALAKLKDLLISHEFTSALHWDPTELPIAGAGEMLREIGVQSAEGIVVGAADRDGRTQALDAVPVCISGADAAIAESGSIVVVSGEGRGRLASLIAPVHIALLPAECVVRTLPDAFELLKTRFGREVVHERANVAIISGPSRSADIEQTLTLGVHGPKEIHVIIFDE